MIKTVLVRILFVMLPALVIVGLHTDIFRKSNELSTVPNLVIHKLNSIMRSILSWFHTMTLVDKESTNGSNGSSEKSTNESSEKSTKESSEKSSAITEGFNEENVLDSSDVRLSSKSEYGVVAFDEHASSDLTDRDFDRLPAMFNEMRERSKKFRKKNDWVSSLIQKRQMEEVALACSTIRKCESSHVREMRI